MDKRNLTVWTLVEDFGVSGERAELRITDQDGNVEYYPANRYFSRGDRLTVELVEESATGGKQE